MSDSHDALQFRVSIDNFLECRAKPVVLVVVVQEGLEESWSWSQVVVTRPQVSEKLAGALADLFDRAAVQLAALLHAGPPEALHLPSLWVCTPSLVEVKMVLIEGVCGAFKFTATPPSAAGACPGMNGSSSSRRSLTVSLR